MKKNYAPKGWVARGGSGLHYQHEATGLYMSSRHLKRWEDFAVYEFSCSITSHDRLKEEVLLLREFGSNRESEEISVGSFPIGASIQFNISGPRDFPEEVFEAGLATLNQIARVAYEGASELRRTNTSAMLDILKRKASE